MCSNPQIYPTSFVIRLIHLLHQTSSPYGALLAKFTLLVLLQRTFISLGKKNFVSQRIGKQEIQTPVSLAFPIIVVSNLWKKCRNLFFNVNGILSLSYKNALRLEVELFNFFCLPRCVGFFILGDFATSLLRRIHQQPVCVHH